MTMPSPLTLRIEGKPTPKGRPRASIVRGHVRIRTPEKTLRAETQMALLMGRLYDGPTLTGPLVMKVEFVFGRPRKMFRRADSAGRIPHAVKPDVDNLSKLVMDAAQGCRRCGSPKASKPTLQCCCYHPLIRADSQVVFLQAIKWVGAIEDRRAKVAEAAHTMIHVKELMR
jgi:Holliday junction resolvase RusA-like endonuclease